MHYDRHVVKRGSRAEHAVSDAKPTSAVCWAVLCCDVLGYAVLSCAVLVPAGEPDYAQRLKQALLAHSVQPKC